MSFKVDDKNYVPRFQPIISKKETVERPVVSSGNQTADNRVIENDLFGAMRKNLVQRNAFAQPAPIVATLTARQPPTPYEAVEEIQQLPVPNQTDPAAIRHYNQQRAQIADAAIANGKPPSRESYAMLPGRTGEFEYRDALYSYNSTIASLRDISARAKTNPTELPLDAPLPLYSTIERINQIPVPNPADADALDQYIQQTQMIAEAALAQAKPPNREDYAGLPGRMADYEYTSATQAYNQNVSQLQPFANGISYVRYDATVDYMFDEMMTNLDSEEFHFIKDSLDLITDPPLFSDGSAAPGYLTAALTKFYNQVKSGGPWDHKPILQERLGLEPDVDLRFPARGDTEHEVFYDIWSNIHYGYIGTAAGFDQGTLQTGANISEHGTGTNDPVDRLTIQIGIDLWNEYGADLTKEQFDYEVQARIPEIIAAQETPEYTSKNPDFQHVSDIYEGNRR